jgi:hypothetical protein
MRDNSGIERTVNELMKKKALKQVKGNKAFKVTKWMNSLSIVA